MGTHHNFGLSNNLFSVAVTKGAQGAGTGGEAPQLKVNFTQIVNLSLRGCVSRVLPSLPERSKVNCVGAEVEAESPTNTAYWPAVHCDGIGVQLTKI
ncbi:hypothetical protein GL2_13540 [Microbulbifer sp. GL-2]|nr:hypothetical protein GL2_13540 [Microbulbifer sp. GL-2]